MAIRSTASLTATQQECVLAKPYVPYDGPIVTRKEAIENNLKKYFTGQKCSRGHIFERCVKHHQCIQCRRELNREKYLRDSSYFKNYYIKNKQRKYETDRVWKSNNRDRVCGYAKNYRENNPEKARANSRAYVARKRLCDGRFSSADIIEIGDIQNWLCNDCGEKCETGYHVDHVMPVNLGGSNWPENLQVLCPTCNIKKRDCHPDDWDARRGKVPEVDGWRKFQQLVIQRLSLPIER